MSHEGCSGSFENGKQIVEKLRMMGFGDQCLPVPLLINCQECGTEFEMDTFETKCPECENVYAVTPCHAFSSENVMCAGRM